MPEPSAFEVELAIGKQKSHKPAGTDRIPTELIKTGGMTIRPETHKLMDYICNKAEVREDKESIIVQYRSIRRPIKQILVISRLKSTSCTLSDVLLSKEIIGDNQCGFRRNRPTTDRIFCIRHILDKKWEYNEKCISYLYISREPMV